MNSVDYFTDKLKQAQLCHSLASLIGNIDQFSFKILFINYTFKMLSTILNASLFEDVKCQWSLSRPLLGLILLQEECFQQWKMELLANQPQDKRAAFEEVGF